MKVLALVLSAHSQPFIRMAECIKTTWGAKPPDGLEVLYYEGVGACNPSAPPVTRIGDLLVCNVDEFNINKKTVMAFAHVLKTCQFDFLLRTCCGAYIMPKRLLKWLSDKPTQGLYAGHPSAHQSTDIPWASGQFYILSRDLVQLVVDNEAEVLAAARCCEDDVALGRFMRSRGIKITRILRFPADNIILPRADGQWAYHFSRSKIELMHSLHAQCVLLEKDCVNSKLGETRCPQP